jgi:gas vesicle protein
MNDSTKTLLAFIGGTAVGALVGILLAPDKGSQTRKRILSRAKDLAEDLTDTASEGYDRFVNWKDKMTGNVKDDAENMVREGMDHGGRTAERFKNATPGS